MSCPPGGRNHDVAAESEAFRAAAIGRTRPWRITQYAAFNAVAQRRRISALHLISTSAVGLGNAETATVARAGGSEGKNSMYTRFIAVKSAISIRKTVHSPTSAIVAPAVCSDANVFQRLSRLHRHTAFDDLLCAGLDTSHPRHEHHIAVANGNRVGRKQRRNTWRVHHLSTHLWRTSA